MRLTLAEAEHAHEAIDEMLDELRSLGCSVTLIEHGYVIASVDVDGRERCIDPLDVVERCREERQHALH